MDGIDKVNPTSQSWRITPKEEQRRQKKREEKQDKDKDRSDSREQQSDDGRPHIDEYA